MADAINQQQSRWARLLGRARMVDINEFKRINQDQENESRQPSREYIKAMRSGAPQSIREIKASRRPDVSRSEEKINRPPVVSEKPFNKSEKTQQRELASQRRFSFKGKLKGEAEGIMDKATAPARKGTSALLKSAWTNLIQSFGLTLLYINAHVFLRFVFGSKIFCKLGQEWIPEKALKANAELGEKGNKGLGMIEVIVLIILDLIVLSLIALIIGILGTIVYALFHPIDFLKAAGLDILSIIKTIADFIL